MATRQHGAAGGTRRRAARAVAALAIALAASACAKFPTAPDSTGMQKWEGEPVTTCVNGGCPISGARTSSQATPARD